MRNTVSSHSPFSYSHEPAKAPLPEPAGFWLRLFAYTYDSIIVSLILSALGALALFAAFSVIGLSKLDLARMTISPTELLALLRGPGVIFFAIWILMILVLNIAYGTLCEASRYQATVGKMLMGLEVSNAENVRLTRQQALRRNILKQKWTALGCIFALLFVAALLMQGITPPALLLLLVPAVVSPIGWMVDTAACGMTRHKQTFYDRSASTFVDCRPDVSAKRRIIFGTIAAILLVSGALSGSSRSHDARFTFPRSTHASFGVR